MILNSKQLEELENIQDSSGEFDEESSDSDGYVEGVENALAWRRGMIERAVTNIRKVIRKPIDTMDGLVSGSLVYLKDSKRFVRVHEDQEGNSELSFVSPVSLAPQPGSKSEKTKKRPKSTKAEEVKVPIPAVAPTSPKAAKPKAKAVKEAPLAQKAPEKKSVPPSKIKEEKVKKAASKKVAQKEKTAAKIKQAPVKKAVKPTVKKSKEISKTKKTPLRVEPKKTKVVSKKAIAKKKPKRAASIGTASYSSKNADPVADPNGYIRGNFRLMSNKELSHVTGLSEHTIRRKLGEWGLKRI